MRNALKYIIFILLLTEASPVLAQGGLSIPVLKPLHSMIRVELSKVITVKEADIFFTTLSENVMHDFAVFCLARVGHKTAQINDKMFGYIGDPDARITDVEAFRQFNIKIRARDDIIPKSVEELKYRI